jgi:predicted AAA+ superfamily ATPase
MIGIPIPTDIKKREIISSLIKELSKEEILLITGSRQAGKTYLLYMLIEHLLQRTFPKQIFFFDLESLNELELLESFRNFNDFVDYLKIRGADLSLPVFVFIDEIQYLTHPSNFLKYLYDHYKSKIKFIVSGSSSLEIKKKFTDRLTGRASRFNIHPSSFKECLFFAGEEEEEQNLQEINLGKLLTKGITKKIEKTFDYLKDKSRRLYENFSIFGGYPKVVLAEQASSKMKILNEIYSTYVRKDIRDIGGITDISGFNTLTKLLAFQIGSLVNESELTQAAGISRPTVRNYLFLLENTFVCHQLLPFFTNRRQEVVKMPKVYFEDVGLRNSIVNDFRLINGRQDGGFLIENSVFCQLLKTLPDFWEIHFWRTERKNEVDFILLGEEKEIVPIEVKYSNFRQPFIPSNLKLFIKKYQPKKAVVVTKSYLTKAKFNSTQILFVPAWMI